MVKRDSPGPGGAGARADGAGRDRRGHGRAGRTARHPPAEPGARSDQRLLLPAARLAAPGLARRDRPRRRRARARARPGRGRPAGRAARGGVGRVRRAHRRVPDRPARWAAVAVRLHPPVRRVPRVRGAARGRAARRPPYPVAEPGARAEPGRLRRARAGDRAVRDRVPRRADDAAAARAGPARGGGVRARP